MKERLGTRNGNKKNDYEQNRMCLKRIRYKHKLKETQNQKETIQMNNDNYKLHKDNRQVNDD